MSCSPTLAAALPLALLLAACTGGSSSGVATSKSIGPAGGTVTAPDGTAVTFASGALAKNQMISIAQSNVDDSNGAFDTVGTAYEMTPADLDVSQAGGVTITLAFDPAQVRQLGLMTSDLAIYEDLPNGWLALAAQQEDASHLTLAVNGLGRFVVGVPAENALGECGVVGPELEGGAR